MPCIADPIAVKRAIRLLKEKRPLKETARITRLSLKTVRRLSRELAIVNSADAA